MTEDLRIGGIAVIDFGSQYTQLIARRIREAGVYAEVFPFDAPADHINRHQPRGYILSGGPESVYKEGAPQLQPALLRSGLPILGVCYGMQAMTHALGGEVASAQHREFGRATLAHTGGVLFKDVPPTSLVWMSHGDRIERPAPGFTPLATSDHSPYAAIADEARGLYGVQFHPEVNHTEYGRAIYRNFVIDVCGCDPKWTPGAFIDDTIERIRAQVGDERVLLALSGGVDSSVVAALLQKAIGDRLICCFVNTGMLRLGEAEQVTRVFRDERGLNLTAIDATEEFLTRLHGVTDPEQKRKTVGKAFIDTFSDFARSLEGVTFLAQGTIYPDVIESAHSSRASKTIKSHHNVGGLPDDLQFELVEPIRDLFKDEVRKVGEALGLPESIIWRQPFPGPGLAVRCPGEITWDRLETLRAADAIFTNELHKAGLLRHDEGMGTSQAFAVLLPVKAVGVMGDERTYEEVVVLRAVVTDDFMTADWARLDSALLARVSSQIVNTVKGVNRVLYDITSKPPGTIEWE
ncbi:MAG: glutamine-hydrolyzing GMP synthase [Chloroflexi bacterium]|nr:glutamine-hydrolyzing GMP synthase [Chloroflexota bacterium]GIK28939.1 MAG: GMP synthase [glutamine-hydrolyzing] [Chloroflexota bacterium]